jgi:hypothetical protein
MAGPVLVLLLLGLWLLACSLLGAQTFEELEQEGSEDER